MAGNVYRKQAEYRVAERYVPNPSIYAGDWYVKVSNTISVPQQLLDFDRQVVATNPMAEVARRAFEIAGIEYGRADIGSVNGRPQIYEINFNPDIRTQFENPNANPVLGGLWSRCEQMLFEAMRAVDSTASGSMPTLRTLRANGVPAAFLAQLRADSATERLSSSRVSARGGTVRRHAVRSWAGRGDENWGTIIARMRDSPAEPLKWVSAGERVHQLVHAVGAEAGEAEQHGLAPGRRQTGLGGRAQDFGAVRVGDDQALARRERSRRRARAAWRKRSGRNNPCSRAISHRPDSR